MSEILYGSKKNCAVNGVPKPFKMIAVVVVVRRNPARATNEIEFYAARMGTARAQTSRQGSPRPLENHDLRGGPAP